MLAQVLGGLILSSVWLALPEPVAALPDPADIPEEILRHQEQLWLGRSPLDNTELDYAAYQALMAELAAAQTTTPQLSPELQQTIMLLQMLKVVRSISPF